MTQIPQQRLDELYAWLVDCAEAGRPCPRNNAICERFGLASPSSAAKLVARLEGAGRIAVERTRSTRRVTIADTGTRTTESRPGGALSRREPVRKQSSAPVIPLPRRVGPKGRQCQWIEGEPSADDSCKCRLETIPGKPWCAAHYPRVWRPAQRVEA